jgi:hypothetical protein
MGLVRDGDLRATLLVRCSNALVSDGFAEEQARAGAVAVEGLM